MPLIPAAWLPGAKVQRVILHWTCGRRKANDVDIAHYHFLIEEDKGTARLVRGVHTISDNEDTGDGDYAAHTLNCNRFSVGIALCGMMDCEEMPFDPGPEPFTQAQWDLMLTAAAEVCRRYGIEVTPKTVLGHGEVQTLLGIRQRGKWDPLRLPWDPALSYEAVGRLIRQEVAARVEVPMVTRSIDIAGRTFTGTHQVMVEDGETFIALRAIADHLGWTVLKASEPKATVQWADKTQAANLGGKLKQAQLEFEQEGERGFVKIRDVAAALGLPVSYNHEFRRVTVG